MEIAYYVSHPTVKPLFLQEANVSFVMMPIAKSALTHHSSLASTAEENTQQSMGHANCLAQQAAILVSTECAKPAAAIIILGPMDCVMSVLELPNVNSAMLRTLQLAHSAQTDTTPLRTDSATPASRTVPTAATLPPVKSWPTQ